MVLVTVPDVVLVTLALMVQPPTGISLPLARMMVLPPMLPATVPVQLLVGTEARVTPAGRLSTRSAVSTAATVLALPRVMVRVLMPPLPMVSGANILVTVGGVAVTVRSSSAGSGLLPRSVTRPPAGMVLVNVPGVSPVTGAVIVHEPGVPPGIWAPVCSVMTEPPAVPATVPTQVVTGVPVRVTPAGKVSTRSLVRVAGPALALVRVMVSVLLPPTSMLSGSNCLATAGAVLDGTVTVAGHGVVQVSVALALAVFSTGLGGVSRTWAVIAHVTWPPTGRLARVWFNAPVPLAAGQVAPLLAVQVQVKPVRPAGTGSVTITLLSGMLPVLATVTV